MDRLDSYLNQICWSIGGPKALREHVRQELRAHLLDAVEQHKTAGLTDDEAVTRAMEEFGRPEDLRPELEATHGHRMLAVLIDRALQWKERTMRAKWMWSSWAYLTLSLVVALELLFIAFNVYFIVPKFQAIVYDGFIDGEFLRKLGDSWMLTFLWRLETVEQKYGWSILLAAAAAIGLFEWLFKGENNHGALAFVHPLCVARGTSSLLTHSRKRSSHVNRLAESSLETHRVTSSARMGK